MRTTGCYVLLAASLLGDVALAAPRVFLHHRPAFGSPLAYNVTLQVPLANAIWLVVSSRPTYEQASIVAQSFAATLGPTLIARSRNGSFAVMAGTLFKDKAKPNLRTLKELRLIPNDAFLSNGEGFNELISHSYTAGSSTDLMTQAPLINSVKRLQMAMARVKLYSGTADGLMGPGTVKAFAAYTSAFGGPPGDYLDAYAIEMIEQSARDGFHSTAERQVAQAMGFEDGETYDEAMKGGFSSPQALFRARQRGFQTQQDFDAAMSGGFDSAEEFQKARFGGFHTVDEYRTASRFRFGTRTDYVAFRSSGFADKDSFQKARERGFVDKTSFERAVAADLKAARMKAGILLDDAQVFIRLNPQIPNLIEIADKASVLGVTLSTGNPSNLEQASSQLSVLLTPLQGYIDFVSARDKERAEDHRKHVLGDQQELEAARAALTKWVAGNISSSKLPQVVQELKLLGDAIPSDDLDRLQDAKQSVSALIVKNVLARELPGYAGPGTENVPIEQIETNAPFAVTPANAVLLRGAADDVVVLFNASADAPSLVRTLNGGFSFSQKAASVCLLGIEETPALKRGLRTVLMTFGASVLKTTVCTSRSPQRADILLIGRKAFLEATPSFAVAFLDALEAKMLRTFAPIDYGKLASKQKEEAALVAEITSGISAGTRPGFGAFEVPASEGHLCLAVTEDAAVHLEMTQEVTALVETSKPMPVISERNLERLYSLILRDECRLVYGPASSLQQITQALKRDEHAFTFLPVWFEKETVTKEARKLADIELAKTRRLEADRLAAEEGARLAEIQRKEELSQRVVVEAELRKASGSAANARLAKFVIVLKASVMPVAGQPFDAQNPKLLYVEFLAWLQAQANAGWELDNIDTAVSDYGDVLWKNRKLDALVTQAVFKLKSRERGEYRSECFLFGIVLDDEFEMERDPVAAPCKDEKTKIGTWKIGHGFASCWRATASADEQQ
jgi:peptidoglycan hydrolase-like protein with peptidoglycan-binding domain